MCDLSGQTYLAIASLIVGAGTGYVQSQNQKAIGKQQEQTAQIQADDATKRGKIEADAIRRRTLAQLGQQRSALAASGVEIDEGSASDLLADTALIGELDALTTEANAEREAFGFRRQGDIARFRGDTASSNTLISAGGSLLSGGAKAVDLEKSSRQRKKLLAAGG